MAKRALPDSLTVTIDGWQSRRGIECISSGIGGPGFTKPQLIGLEAGEGKITAEKIVKMHQLAVQTYVDERRVGLIIHDNGRNVKKAAVQECARMRSEGRPVFEAHCGLHNLSLFSKDIMKAICGPEADLTNRCAIAVQQCRRIRDEYRKLSREVAGDASLPVMSCATRMLSTADNMLSTVKQSEVFKKIAVDKEVGATFKKKVFGPTVKFTFEQFMGDPLWQRIATHASILEECAIAMRAMQATTGV